jgi:hypothetical protein
MTLRTTLVTGLLTAGLAVPASASAATIAVRQSCAAAASEVVVAGAGFSPNATVNISGGIDPTTATTDATGTFEDSVIAPDVNDFVAHPLTLTAVDATNPALAATATVPIIREFFATNFPVNGKPSDRVAWQFTGFAPGKPIYGHYRWHKKTIKNFRFGSASGPCGTLTTHARRLPTTSHPGDWSVQFDQLAIYNRFTKPRRVATFSITRTFG